MSRHHDKPPPSADLDWSNPEIQSLLSKTEGWSLDNRDAHNRVACELHIGGGAGVAKSATLVYERDRVVVIETPFKILDGEQVRLDCIRAGTLRSSWGTVVSGREGNRAEDRAKGLCVYWVRLRA